MMDYWKLSLNFAMFLHYLNVDFVGSEEGRTTRSVIQGRSHVSMICDLKEQ